METCVGIYGSLNRYDETWNDELWEWRLSTELKLFFHLITTFVSITISVGSYILMNIIYLTLHYLLNYFASDALWDEFLFIITSKCKLISDPIHNTSHIAPTLYTLHLFSLQILILHKPCYMFELIEPARCICRGTQDGDQIT